MDSFVINMPANVFLLIWSVALGAIRWSHSRVPVYALVLLATGASACGWQAPPPPTRDPAVADLLWLPPQAQIQPDDSHPLLIRNGRSVYADGTAAVRFTVDMECDALVGLVLAQAGAAEWHRRNTPVDNPQDGLPTGNRCLPAAEGGGWSGEWDDHRGDVIRYAFSQQGPQIVGHVRFMPHDLVVQANARPRK